jgi:hypothetical protein
MKKAQKSFIFQKAAVGAAAGAATEQIRAYAVAGTGMMESMP